METRRLNYTVVRDDHHGRHIEFAQPIHEGNFIEACTVAIALARELRDADAIFAAQSLLDQLPA